MATNNLSLKLMRAKLSDNPPAASHRSIHVYHCGFCCLVGVTETFYDSEISSDHLNAVSI